MSTKLHKAKLRSHFKSERDKLSATDLKNRSHSITENFIKNLLPKISPKSSPKIFSLYIDSGNEVQTEFLADYFIAHGIKFAYPKVRALKQELEFIMASKDQKFVNCKFFPKIIEPRGGEKILPDVLILPLLAFDADLARLGMGGGFYDRTIEFLKKQNPQIITVGLAFDIQRSLEPLAIENTDQKLDFIVTEKNIFSRS